MAEIEPKVFCAYDSMVALNELNRILKIRILIRRNKLNYLPKSLKETVGVHQSQYQLVQE